MELPAVGHVYPPGPHCTYVILLIIRLSWGTASRNTGISTAWFGTTATHGFSGKRPANRFGFMLRLFAVLPVHATPLLCVRQNVVLLRHACLWDVVCGMDAVYWFLCWRRLVGCAGCLYAIFCRATHAVRWTDRHAYLNG
jgi:hypothetical protein